MKKYYVLIGNYGSGNAVLQQMNTQIAVITADISNAVSQADKCRARLQALR